MPKTGRRRRRAPRATGSPASKTRAAVERRDGAARQPAGNPRDLLARICDTPHLARVVPQLPAQLLHGVIQRVGLEDCGELLALATTEQLSAVFDLDLWRIDRPGVERFDASRFCIWLEVLADSSVVAAAHRLAELDADLVIAGLAPQIAVFDSGVFEPSAEGDDDIEITPARERHLHREIGGYTVVARRTDSWDAVIAVLIALSEERPDTFHRVMAGCRRLSNSKPEVDGLDDLLMDSEQGLFDLGIDRESRREHQGYVTPPQASAFLASSRQLRLEQGGQPQVSPIFAAYLRNAAWSDESAPHLESRSAREASDPITSGAQDAAVAAVVSVLHEAGVRPKPPLALLSESDEAPMRFPRLTDHMQSAGDRDAASLRSQELGFLANVLLAGCPVQARSMTQKEAFEAAAATCNLGLENWPPQWLPRSQPDPAAAVPTTMLPEDFLAGQDLVTVFQVGWAVLHRNVSMFAAERLLGTLATLQCTDREVQFDLFVLRRELTRHWQEGEPWRSRNALDVIAMLDMPAWAALAGLIGELPVMLANVGAPSRARSVSPSAFEFISENGQIAAVRAFMESLPDVLSR